MRTSPMTRMVSVFVFVLVSFSPASVFAADGAADAVKEIKAQFGVLQDEFRILQETLAALPKGNGGTERRAALQRFTDKLIAIQQRLVDLKSKAGSQPVAERVLKRGLSGDDVRNLQEFLKQFPDIYPQGLVSGYFGAASEQAIKKLQEKLGIEPAGTIGPKTREKIGELAAAISRKARPHIVSVSPERPTFNSEITLTGSGFLFEGNSIFVKGRIIEKDISSPDGSMLSFFVTPDFPCSVGEACPVKVVNKNGISNARPFKLVQSDFPPEPPPAEPPLPPRGKGDLTLLSISPQYVNIGAEITLTGTGFSATDNAVVLKSLKTGTLVTGKIEGLSSADGAILKFTLPATPCTPPDFSCFVSVLSKNRTSNELFFTVTQQVTPVRLIVPNGGEQFVQGAANPQIKWSGGTGAVDLWLLEETATEDFSINLSSYGDLLVGLVGRQFPIGDQIFTWDPRSVCDVSSNCWPVSPGKYKIIAVSQNELGNYGSDWIGSMRFYNRDVSDQPFSILPEPKITVLSPNGGEKLMYGVTTTISWEAKSIVSQTVDINLLNAGVLYRTIAKAVPQSAHTGMFLYSWAPTTDLPAGNNYTIEVVGTQYISVRDVSDAPFSIAPKSSITVVKPNGGETWMKGFQATVRWNSGNILSKAVNIDLYKSGVLQRRLASNVPQKFYSWSTQAYSSGTGFNYYLSVPSDVSDGADYSVVVSDAADASVNDASDTRFAIQNVPNPVTVSGRLINRFSTAALANTRLYLDGGYHYMNTATTGEFMVSTSTKSLWDTTIFGGKYSMPVGSWPNCYMNWRYDIFTNSEYPYWRDHLFDLTPDKTGVFNQGTINLGDVPMWPGTGVYFYADSPIITGVSVNYPDSSYGGYQVLALNVDLQAKAYNTSTGQFYSAPPIKIPLENGCTPKTLTYLGGTFKWEPYNIRTSTYPYGYTVGVSVKTTFPASGGVAPYTWGLYYGSLPPGLTLDSSTGTLSGTPTTAGTYKSQVRITDANGVNGGGWPITLTVK